MRYIVTTNRHIQLIEDNDNGKILDSKGFQFGQLYYRIVKGKVTFYHFDQEHPWRNDVWSADIPLQINGELYENEEEVGNKLYEVMEDSLFDKIEDLIKEDARLDQKIDDEIDRAKEEEVKLSDKVDGLEDEVDAIDHKVDGYDEKINAAENKVDGLDEKLEKEILRSSEKDAEHDAFISNFSGNLEAEVERAKAAESALTQALNSEIQRAISAETEIANDLDAEVTRATNRENEIENKLNSEIIRSTEKDAIHDEKLANLDTSLQNETERATEAENSLRSDLNSEVSRATAEEDRIDAKLDKEIADRIADVDAEEARALSAETRLESKIDAEITRSTNKDTEHDEKIVSLEQADENITNALNSEIQRALSAETSLRDDLNGEITRANAEETRIEGLLADEINRSTAKDTEHDEKIASLEDELSEEIARAKSEEKRVDDKLGKEIADRTADVDAEEARARAAEEAIDDKLNKEITRSTEKDVEHSEKISGLTDDFNDLSLALNSEIQRALSAETSLHNEILGEKERAITSESALDTKITTEVSDRTADVRRERERAIARENEIDDKLDKEIYDRTAYVDDERDRAISAETALDTKIVNEISRATATEATLNTKLKEEEDRAIARENAIDSRLDKEVTDRTDADTAERNRAQAEELRIESKINAEVTRSTNKDTEHDNAITSLTKSIADEVLRSTSKDDEIVARLTQDEIDAESKHTALNGKIDAEITRATTKESEIETKVNKNTSDIEALKESDGNQNTRLSVIENTLPSKADKANAVASAAYSANTKSIYFYNEAGAILSIIDATDFIKDGMVSDVYVRNGNLVIKFNTDAGQTPIEIPISDIFNADNYYTKAEINASQEAQDANINKLSGDVTNLSSAVTKNANDIIAINTKIENLPTDLSNYYNKSEVDAKVNDKQDKLIAGVNIKTINGETLLGSGNITIQGGGVNGYTKAETDALLSTKQNTLVAGENISIVGNVISASANVDLDNYYTKAQSDGRYMPIGTVVPTKVSQLQNDVPYLTSASLDNYVTDSELASKGYLTEHQPLKTINGNVISGTGNIEIASNNVIELTQAEYDLLPEKDLDALYVITDAPVVDFTNYYTKTQIDSVLSQKADKAYVDASMPKIWSGTKAEFDAITTKDANTIYLIYEE